VILPLGHFDYYYFHFLLQDTSLSGRYAILGNGGHGFDFLLYDDHRQLRFLKTCVIRLTFLSNNESISISAMILLLVIVCIGFDCLSDVNK
jgi:hypothetical protein